MKIEIKKNEQNVPVLFCDDKSFEFNYQNLMSFIDIVSKNDEELSFDVEEGMEEYQKLLIEIATSCRTDDFRQAVKSLEDAKKQLELEDKKLYNEDSKKA